MRRAIFQLIYLLLKFELVFTQVSISKPTLDLGACSFPTQYFTLGNISIAETQNGDFSIGTTKTIIVNAPSGLLFQTNTGSISVVGGRNLSNESITVTSSNITIQFSCTGINKLDIVTISGIKICATTTGIYFLNRNSGTSTINGCSNGTSLTGNISFNLASANQFRTNPTLPGLLDWNNATTWECNSIPPNDGTANVIIRSYQNGVYNSGNAVYFSSSPYIKSIIIENNANLSPPGGNSQNLNIIANLTIQAGGFLEQLNWSQSGINNIKIGGDFINNGAMISSSGSGGNGLCIIMNGTSPQLITGTGLFKLIGNGPGTGSLIITNPTGVELQSNFQTDNSNGNSGNVIVDGLLTFMNPTIKFFGLGNLQLNGKTILKAGTFNEHYAMSGTRTIANTSTIEYTNLNSSIALTNIPSMNLNNLIINNTIVGITTISNPLSVGGTLSMLGGNIINGNNTIQIGTSTVNRGSLNYNSGVIIGKLKRWFLGTNNGNQSGLFPLGNSIDFEKRFAKVEYTQSTNGGSILGEWINQPMGNNVTNQPINTNCNGSFTISNTSSGYWTMIPSDGITNNENITYIITLSAINLSDFGNDCHITAVKRDNNNIWSYSGLHVDNSGTATNPIITRINATGWSNWGLGGEGEPLPIELLSMNASCQGENIVFNWATASENNSYSFILEKSENCSHWVVSKEIPAAGFSNQIINYSILDNRIEGINYYRLSQTDIDGELEIYDPIHVDCKDENPFKILVWPNPEENGFNIIINNPMLNGVCIITIRNMMGLEVLKRELFCESGINLFNFSDLKLPSGLYFIQVHNEKYFSEVIKHLIK